MEGFDAGAGVRGVLVWLGRGVIGPGRRPRGRAWNPGRGCTWERSSDAVTGAAEELALACA